MIELDRGKIRADFKRVVKIKNKIMVPLEYGVKEDCSEIARLSNCISKKENVEYIVEKIDKNLYEYIQTKNGQLSTKEFARVLDLSKVKEIYNLAELFEAVTLEAYEETKTRFRKDDEILDIISKIKRHKGTIALNYEDIKNSMSIDTMEEIGNCLEYSYGQNQVFGFWEEVINDKTISIGDVVKWRFRQMAEEFEEQLGEAILINKTVYSFKEQKYGRIKEVVAPILGKKISFKI